MYSADDTTDAQYIAAHTQLIQIIQLVHTDKCS